MNHSRMIITGALFAARMLAAQTDSTVTETVLRDLRPVFQQIPEQSVFPEQTLTVPLTAFSPEGHGLVYSFTWDRGGRIDPARNLFIWRAATEDIGIHPIIFSVEDTTARMRVNQAVIITVTPIRYPPVLTIKSTVDIPSGFLEIDEGEELALVLQADDANDQDRLSIGYFVNGDRGYQLENAEFKVNGRSATFFWVPQDRHAKKRIFNITFYAEDQTGLRTEETVRTMVRDISHAPVFLNTTHEYFIDEGEKLTFSMRILDQDGDDIDYQVYSPDIKQNDFLFDQETGKFQWTPVFAYASTKTEYRLIFSASDRETTVYDTVMIKVDPKNYPPHIEDIPPREIKEGETLSLRLHVTDKNGDEQVDVSVVYADADDYVFDKATRSFRWTPGFGFVDEPGKRTVLFRFRAADREYSDDMDLKVTVYDRVDPAEIIAAYRLQLQRSGEMLQEVRVMDRSLQHTIDRKRFWDNAFDITGILVGAFTGYASSSAATAELREKAVPVAAVATTLIGIRSVIDRSGDKVMKLRNSMLTLKGSIEVTISMLTREYGDRPDPETADKYEFQSDFKAFKNRMAELEKEKALLKAQYEAMRIRPAENR
ncbi:hypothetical protein JXO52_05605 [bacterium]|nr:hypothetical protein [bacterium]